LARLLLITISDSVSWTSNFNYGKYSSFDQDIESIEGSCAQFKPEIYLKYLLLDRS